MPEHADVIVIGSGAGGGAVTWALAPTGAKVLLLERGDWLPREPENWSPQALWADKRYQNSGQWTDGADGRRFSPKQNYYVGGNTKFYGAILYRFRERDFGAVQHVDGVSPGRSPTQTWRRTTSGPSGSTRCTARAGRTPTTRRPPAPTRGRRSATSRGSPSSGPT